MIILGSKGKTITIDEGHFNCPHCNTRRKYELKEVGKYFSVYFIPLIKMEKLAEYVECQFCHTHFEKTVLSHDSKLQNRVQNMLKEIHKEINSGIPISVIRKSLAQSGTPEEAINNLLAAATDGKPKICPTCNLVYANSLKFCSADGTELVEPS